MRRRILRLIAVKFLGRFVQHALVMFCMLQIAFGQNAVSGRIRIARQRLVFLGDLNGVATNADIRPVAVKNLHPRVDPALLVMLTPAVMVMATAPAVVMATAESSSVIIVSHASLCVLCV